jgi:uncharacterized coiled-coil protein SlyX
MKAAIAIDMTQAVRLYLRTCQFASPLAGRLLPALLGICIASLVCGGCAALARNPAKDGQREVAAMDAGQPIMAAELDELTRAFADRYIGLLYSTCDALKKDNPDPVQRREAQVLMVDCATNIYDIASNADAFTRMLDLVVVTTLVSQVWIDDDRVSEVFAGREELLIRALHHGRVEAWALAAQVLRPEQLDLMDYLLWDWRRHNPDMVRASFVRFSNFAIGRGKSANSEVLAASGLLANVGQAGQAVAETRLLTERMFYMLKRESNLLRWQADTLKEDIFIALDDRIKQAEAKVANAKDTISEANGVVTSLGQTSNSIKEMLKTADTLFARFDTWNRWGIAQGYRPFEIREYTEAVKELAVTAGKMNDLFKSSNELLGSSEWDRRIQQSKLLVDTVFQRIYLTLGMLFAMLILYRLITLLLMRRVRIVESNAGKPRQGSSDEAGQEVRPANNLTPRIRIVEDNAGKPRQGNGGEAGQEVRPANNATSEGRKGISE